MNAQEIVEKLNAVEEGSGQPGQNSAEVWDFIQGLDEWDEPATQEIDPSGASDRFKLTTGETIRWDEQTKRWYEQS